MLYTMMEMLDDEGMMSESFKKHPRLAALQKRVNELPGVQAYLKIRPKTSYDY